MQGGETENVQEASIPEEFRELIFGRDDGQAIQQPMFGGLDNPTTGERVAGMPLGGKVPTLEEYIASGGGGVGDSGVDAALTESYNRKLRGR